VNFAMHKKIAQTIIGLNFLYLSFGVLADEGMPNGKMEHQHNIFRPPPSTEMVRVQAEHTDDGTDDAIFHPMEHAFSGAAAAQRQDLSHESIITFWHKIFSENTMGVAFSTRDEKCYGYRAVVEERNDSIAIAVVQGAIPAAPEACNLMASKRYFLLQLKNPVGNRKIIPLDSIPLNQ